MSWSGDEVLDRCTEAAGLEYDPVLGRRLIHQAEREIPGPPEETWTARLAMIGKAFGLRMTRVRWSPREAIAAARPEMPVVAFVPGAEDEGGRWVVLVGRDGRRGRLAAAERGGRQGTIAESELARRLGLQGRSEPADWLVVLPIAPGDGMRDPDAEGSHAGLPIEHHAGDAHDGPSPLRRLFGLMRPELQRDLWLIIAYAVGVGILSLATPLAIEMLVTTVALNQMYQQLVVLTAILFACLALVGLLRGLQTYMVELMQRRVFVRVAADLAYRLPRVRIDAYDRANGPELVNRFFEVLTVQKVAALLLLDGISVVLGAAFGLIVLAFYHPFLLGFDLVVLGAMTFLVFLLGRGAIRTSVRESLAKYRVAAALEEVARTPLAYKVDGAPDFAMDRTDALTRRYLTARRRHFAVLMRQIIFALALQAVATSALLGLGGLLVIREDINLGQLVAAELIVATVVAGFTKLGKHLEAWYDLMAAMDKLGRLVDLPLERSDGEGYRELDRAGASLEIRGLSYGYEPHREVLHRLDLHVGAGERVAVVGPSGSGKTTLVDLLFGLREPTRGTIELDGLNLRDLRLESLREQVAMVKGLDLVEDSILENVRVGRAWLSLAEVRAALEAVGLLDEVSELHDGMQTRLMGNGAPLSLGQARRVMLARAIAGRPRLLLIDEGLDALDLDARRRVLETLFDRSAPWTLLLVTHAGDVADRCDRVVALTDGRAEHSLTAAKGRGSDLESWLKGMDSCRLN